MEGLGIARPLRDELGHVLHPLRTVARRATGHEVRQMIRPARALRNQMIDVEIVRCEPQILSAVEAPIARQLQDFATNAGVGRVVYPCSISCALASYRESVIVILKFRDGALD